VNTDSFDFPEEPADQALATGNGEVDDLPGLIAFDDLFSQDEALRQRLDQIVEQVQPNEQTKAADFTVDADDDQRKFIECPADTIRLLAPAGSGKTQSVVNRVLTQVAAGQSLDRFLILTFDNAASLSLKEKLERGIAASGLKVRASASIYTLNGFGLRLLTGILRGRFVQGDVQTNSAKDSDESVRRALEKLKAENPAVHQFLPRRLARRVYLDLISTLKNKVILADRLVQKDPAMLRQFLDLADQTGLLKPWLEPHRGATAWEAAKTKVPSVLVYIYKLYNDINRNHKRIDFDDQKLLAYLGLESDERLAKMATSQYTSVVVDEFQDINRLDFEFIKLLARGKQLIVVGDDDELRLATEAQSRGESQSGEWGNRFLRDVQGRWVGKESQEQIARKWLESLVCELLQH
jgi:DNA helicase-2/ATP-dependent DNA helicase PcrA